DNGSICASEQAVVVKIEEADQVIEEFERRGGYFLSPDEIEKVGRIAYDRERRIMNATVVGQSAQRIAESAGIEVPEGTVLLLARLEGVGPDYPLSAEILAPILAFYVEEDFDGSIRRCTEVTSFGGAGHTAVVYSNNDERIEYFSQVINAGRILVNMPSTQGALGGIYNSLDPSFTLSCGSDCGNIMLDNITTRHLLNTHRITRRRPNPRWMRFDKDDYLDQSIPAEEIERQYNQNF
ncbi:MAG: bifunctional acetaldehyde-CoA/alcohol dehydrogenase, partial [Candidatus Krumholzibacteria bacterium]|nr:bifunctional acetaldehyde-CoA/alcohol dehydrogenase [Candidatus Krumholzibacteria bacterium]